VCAWFAQHPARAWLRAWHVEARRARRPPRQGRLVAPTAATPSPRSRPAPRCGFAPPAGTLIVSGSL